MTTPDREFSGLLFATVRQPQDRQPSDDGGFLIDLNLDQVIDAVAADREHQDLIRETLSQRIRDEAALKNRHDVFRDLEDPAVFDCVTAFCGRVRQVRAHLDQLGGMRSAQQREGWFLDAASIYCEAVQALSASLSQPELTSAGLRSFRDYLAAYVARDSFIKLAADTARRKEDLAKITYLVRIKGPRVEVSRFEGEPDYSAEIAETFSRFRQGDTRDYLIKYRGWPGMNHVGAQILDFVARLYSDEFGALAEFGREHAGFLDQAIRRFDREIQFYLAYLSYLAPMRSAGLSFCYPELTGGSDKDVSATGTFDLALAAKLAGGNKTVVTNDFHLADPERVIVVSGPNQGGKTTFARTFGQLHHLAATGCPVPGTAARCFLADQLFTHFEREEDLANLTGKLEDDLLRIQRVLRAATPDSIVIMNEIFTSTTLSDAKFLGEQVMKKVIDLDLLCVYVTFVEELASLGPTVVSMASTIVPDDPAERTYKVLRKPADGLAYALAIARKRRVTYEQLTERLSQ